MVPAKQFDNDYRLLRLWGNVNTKCKMVGYFSFRIWYLKRGFDINISNAMAFSAHCVAQDLETENSESGNT